MRLLLRIRVRARGRVRVRVRVTSRLMCAYHAYTVHIPCINHAHTAQVRLLLRMLRADPGDARRRWFEDD